jgi:AAA15 family ATPase/GTPase
MLVRFVVSNFLSFNEEREFNMLASSLDTHPDHVYRPGKVEVLKASAIYGPNGAGKSNLVKAIEFLQSIVQTGGLTQSIDNKKFKLDSTCINKPITFEIELAIEGRLYHYGLSLEQYRVAEEWLYETNPTAEDALVFTRTTSPTGKTKIEMAKQFQETDKQKLLIELLEENLLKSEELLLGKSEELKLNPITEVRKNVNEKLIIIHPNTIFLGLVPLMRRYKDFFNFINEQLVNLDTGVNSIENKDVDFWKIMSKLSENTVDQIISDLNKGNVRVHPNRLRGTVLYKEGDKYIASTVITKHLNNQGESIEFDFSEESDGTKRLMDFLPIFDAMLKEDATFIIDEIDRSLHPSLLKTLMTKIMADGTTKGQLIFTTHESNLLDLDIFRPDEIWFAEKNRQTGNTELYSLNEFRPRPNLNIQKGYLQGRFGAIPFLGNLENLNWHVEHA